MAWAGHVRMMMTYLVLTLGLVLLDHLREGDVTLIVLVVFRWPFLKGELTVHFLVLLLKAVKFGEGRDAR